MIRPYLLFALLFFFGSAHSLGQLSDQKSTILLPGLKRKGAFGIQMESTNKTGVKVLHVYPHTTASSIGIQEGDTIQSINSKETITVLGIVEMVKEFREGDDVHIKLKRNGTELSLRGKVKGKPLETSPYGNVIYDHVEFDNGKLRTILTVPKNKKKPPVILFMQGVGCGSIDFYFNDQSTVKLLIEDFVKNDLAVMRVEKPGMGDSQNNIGCEDMDYPYEVSAFEAALKKLKTLDNIDTSQIFLFGESLSTITAPMLAQKHNVAGIINWGGVSKSWFEYSLMRIKEQGKLLGKTPDEIDRKYRRLLPFYYDFFQRKLAPKELKKHQDYESFAGDFFNGEMWHGLQHYSFFQSINEIDILSSYSKIKAPVLCLAGEHDIHAVNTQWTNDIMYALTEEVRENSETILIPKTAHHYFEVPSITTYNELRKSKQLNESYMAAHFNHEIASLAAKWIFSLHNKKSGRQ